MAIPQETAKLKESIVNIMSNTSGYNATRFLQAIALCNRVTYSNELRYIDAKIDFVSNYQDKFSSKIKKDSKMLEEIKRSISWIKRRIDSPKLSRKEREKLLNEAFEMQSRMELLEQEMSQTKEVNTLLKDIELDNKETLNVMRRKLERSKVVLQEFGN